MSIQQTKKRNQIRLSRLEIVSALYKRGYSIRQIQAEIITRLGLKTCSVGTIHGDIQLLLKEWRENRLDNIDAALQLELERIDEIVRELWQQWEKSKQDYIKESTKIKGQPTRRQDGIKTTGTEKNKINMLGLGDVSYISEIRAQLIERRKMLGLYAPEKKDITGDVSFAAFLIESGIIDNADSKDE
jgi:hypothetical protein